jgi:hypothetical protein
MASSFDAEDRFDTAAPGDPLEDLGYMALL